MKLTMSLFVEFKNCCRNRPNAVIMFIVLFTVFLFLGYHIRRFAFWLPLVLIVFWLASSRLGLNKARNFADLMPRRLWLALSGYLVSILISSLISPFPEVAIRELLLTLVGPLFIAILACRVMPLKRSARQVLIAMLCGGVLIAATDVIHYLKEFMTLGQFAIDFSHRWRSEGYILYTPFLLLFRDSLDVSRRFIFNVVLILFFILAAGTGSRTTWGVMLIEIVVLGMMLAPRRYLPDVARFILAVAIALLVLPPTLGRASLERGLSDNNRIEGHWKPTLKKATDSLGSLLIGHGYASEVLVTLPEKHYKDVDPTTVPPGQGGPHNVFLRALFVGGLPGLLCLIWLFWELGIVLWHRHVPPDENIKSLAVSGFMAFIGFYLIAGEVGDPRPEPLALFVLLAMLIHQSAYTFTLSAASFPAERI